MKRLAVLTSLMVLPACATVRALEPMTSKFVPVDDITPEIKRLRQIVEETCENYGVIPFPKVRLVRYDHPMLSRGLYVGRAVVFEGGKEAIYVSQDEIDRPARLLPTIEHEAAHLAAWRQFGHDISMHGSEWRAVCLVGATDRAACARYAE